MQGASSIERRHSKPAPDGRLSLPELEPFVVLFLGLVLGLLAGKLLL
jgi:hypothetical protein